MPLEPKYTPYARETAACINLAYDAMEADIIAELEAATPGAAAAALHRLLRKLRARREAIAEFSHLTTKAA